MVAHKFSKEDLQKAVVNSKIVTASFNDIKKIELYKSKCIAKLDNDENIIDVYYSINDAANKNMINKKTVSLICRNMQSKSREGLAFKFIDIELYKRIKLLEKNNTQNIN
jgi:hypothetical protein